MMPKLFFQLGHARDLSHAEILAVNQRLNQPYHSFEKHNDILIAQTETLDHLPVFCQELGGTIRACEWLAENERNQDEPLEQLLQLVHNSQAIDRITSQADRPSFGVSVIGDTSQISSANKMPDLVQKVNLQIKEALKEKGFSSRFVPAKQNSLNAAQVEKNNLMEKGGELVWVITETKLILGITRWIQDFEDFSHRDYGRPQRDAHSGMLPPKLARILINLARVQHTKTILDPFCGSGSILMEAALMGLNSVGSDSSIKAVKDTQANSKWILDNQESNTGTIRVTQADARDLHKVYDPLYFDACVTEPYLGPPLRKPLTAEQFQKTSKSLSELYLRALAEIRTVVKPGARVVFIVPRFQLQDQDKAGTLSVLGTIKLQGYTILDPLQNFKPVSVRSTLIYARPKQFVQREIFVLQA